MKTVCIVVGHSATKGGAYNSEKKMGEYDYNHVLASYIAGQLHRHNVRPIIMYRGSSYTGMVNDVNATNADFSIELHCNSVVNQEVQGGETLYWHKSSRSKALAKKLQAPIVHLLGENNRGIKPIVKGDRGATFLRRTKMPAVILEPFFISNTKSLENGLILREQLASVVAGALVEHILEEFS
ncbi:N-acetylmuramoyl-L-alanine amidase [Vibrio campbellii]|uniref:N-acetylmuramoyl-L-alanine amidase n=1 Tax=Vibrio campbellii TaxID=680 RepID=UPI00210C1639|nr:N-acetylmuramoyl-L-alanine amidase [Vibrio campbellii]UTZ44590.1 N-acetylmuramoyl-L-alanine amidase [Vibrio campbellii]